VVVVEGSGTVVDVVVDSGAVVDVVVEGSGTVVDVVVVVLVVVVDPGGGTWALAGSDVRAIAAAAAALASTSAVRARDLAACLPARWR
jgi:hypothetical protein